METKSDLITYCLTYKDVYEDYPFRDHFCPFGESGKTSGDLKKTSQ